jgi:hypothetical protein
MEIELVPDPGPEDPASRAAVAALSRAGLAEDRVPPGTTSAWRRAGLEGAMDRDVGPETSVRRVSRNGTPAPG